MEKSTLCTLVKMLKIMDDPLVELLTDNFFNPEVLVHFLVLDFQYGTTLQRFFFLL